MPDGVDGVGARRRPAHDLEQPHVTRQVEEVSDEEVTAKRSGGRRGLLRGCWETTTLLAHRVDAYRLLLDVELLDDGLDDPVAVEQRQVVLEVAA
jgi:hypothetical protein